MKKIIVLLFIIFISLFGYNIYINMNNNDNENKRETVEKVNLLLNYGYNDDEYNLLSSVVSDDTIDDIINYKYDKTKVMSVISDEYYIDNNFNRYMNITDEAIDVVEVVNTNNDREYYENVVLSDESMGLLIIVNKFYQLSSNFDGLDLVTISTDHAVYNDILLNNDAYEQFVKMSTDASVLGLSFKIYSGYRSYEYQENLHNSYVERDGQELTDTYSARPGSSEHQTGLAIDLKSMLDDNPKFEETDEYAWLVDNAHLYGFIVRYPDDKTDITGYQFEPWHYRYCGIECATYIYENDITFDEYYEYYVK